MANFHSPTTQVSASMFGPSVSATSSSNNSPLNSRKLRIHNSNTTMTTARNTPPALHTLHSVKHEKMSLAQRRGSLAERRGFGALSINLPSARGAVEDTRPDNMSDEQRDSLFSRAASAIRLSTGSVSSNSDSPTCSPASSHIRCGTLGSPIGPSSGTSLVSRLSICSHYTDDGEQDWESRRESMSSAVTDANGHDPEWAKREFASFMVDPLPHATPVSSSSSSFSSSHHALDHRHRLASQATTSVEVRETMAKKRRLQFH
eukprot:m.177366 g.177366  ORF g.177366 m.177366 type:complete len:261 (+) comp31886_c1_seq1:2425-3207(+)